MRREKVSEFFRRLKATIPEPKTELEYENPYTLLIAVVLSAQATDASVNKATEALFKVADSPERMLKLGERGLKQHIKTIGLYNTKAKNIVALSRALLDKHGAKAPRAVEEALEKAVPSEFKRHCHHWLILHGRYVCKARTPDCPACVVRELCAFKGKTTAA